MTEEQINKIIKETTEDICDYGVDLDAHFVDIGFIEGRLKTLINSVLMSESE